MGTPYWNEGFSVKILDPLWEVLRIEVLEGTTVIGTTEVACGEMLGSVGNGELEQALELPASKEGDATPAGSVFISITKVIEMSAASSNALSQSFSTLAE